jgi:hypothetical protein
VNNNNTIEIPLSDKIDELEAAMMVCDPVDCPLNHKFLPGIYIREILMPAGSLVTSMIHKTTHAYFVLQGKVSVISENFGEQYIESPFTGTTLPNTRRVLYIHENCVWITVHPTSIQPKDGSPEALMEAVALIEDEILDKRENPLIGGRIKNNIITKNIS